MAESRCTGCACTRDGGSAAFTRTMGAASPGLDNLVWRLRRVCVTQELNSPAGGMPGLTAIVELWLSYSGRGGRIDSVGGSVSAQGKVLCIRNYPNPSFGPFVEVCCSIIGVF